MTKIQLAGAAMAGLMAASLGGCTPPPKAAAPAADTGKIADTIKADVAATVAAINAHDGPKAVTHDAPDVLVMFHGEPNLVGPAADLKGFQQFLAVSPDAQMSIADETVDVAASGDMAIDRSTYTFDFTDPKTKKKVTETGNNIWAYKLQPDGTWKIAWSVASDTPATAAAKN
ncbi:MAG TPA: nuclear transport factor 2 family protein [Caulobacteraceae bacterium]|jgi:ketosteroid isomerase-like protein